MFVCLVWFFVFVIQIPDKFGITPLLAAVYEDHVDCVKILIEKVCYNIIINIVMQVVNIFLHTISYYCVFTWYLCLLDNLGIS